MSTIRTFLVGSIDEGMMATLDVDQLGFRFTVRQILDALQARFGLMSPLDLAAARTSLATPYVQGTDMRTFIRSQRDLHLLLAENNSIVNNADQFSNLLATVSVCGQFSKVLDNYLLNHSTLLLQTFQSLSLALVNATDSLSSITVQRFANLASNGSAKPTEDVVLTGKQPNNKLERVVTITQYYCPKHKWQNSLHKSAACVDFVPDK
jgi:hypothetical protein